MISFFRTSKNWHFNCRPSSWMTMVNSRQSPLPPPDTKSPKISYFSKNALSWETLHCMFSKRQITNNFLLQICKISRWSFQSLAEVDTFDVVNQDTRFDTNRFWRWSTDVYKYVYTNMCVQTEIFKYSNLIKTKKNHQNRKTGKFLSIFLIKYYRDEWENFWVLFFVSVLNVTWGIEFSCGTVLNAVKRYVKYTC